MLKDPAKVHLLLRKHQVLSLWSFGLNKHNELAVVNKKQRPSLFEQEAGRTAETCVLLPTPSEFEPFKESGSGFFNRERDGQLKIVQVASGDEHTGVVTKCGRLFMAGSYLMDKLAFPCPLNLNYAK